MTITSRESRLPLPSTAKENVHIILLLCDTPLPPVTEAYGTYHDIFESLFSKSLPPPSNESTQNVKELIIESYNVVSNHYPSLDALQRADFLLISGSAASAYLPEPWIITLVSFVRDLPQVMPGLRIVGICFGHQIVGIAFGGTVQKNELGWEIGVRSLVLTNWGKRIWGGEKLDLHQVHQDHVTSLPKGFHSLASTPISSIHGMIKFFPSSSSPSSSSSAEALDLRSIAILTLQGHPEFHPDMVLRIINDREKGGVIPADVASISRILASHTDEGIRVGRSLLGIMAGI